LFNKLKALIKVEEQVFGRHRLGCQTMLIKPVFHIVGKVDIQTVERKQLTLHTRIKRLAKTICFSKSIWLHDVVIGLLLTVLSSDYPFNLSTRLNRYPAETCSTKNPGNGTETK
jgi:hypothetical protein